MNGFGNPDEEYWIGLEPIHILTNKLGRNRLRVDFEGPDGKKYHMVYQGFSVGDAASKYKLHLGNKVEGNAPEHFRLVSRA